MQFGGYQKSGGYQQPTIEEIHFQYVVKE